MRSQLKVQLFIVVTGLLLLGAGVRTHQLSFKLFGASFLLVWWWMYLREDHLHAVTGFTKRKWTERSLLRKIRLYEEECERARPYIQRFAVTFNVLFPSVWELTSDDTLERIDITDQNQKKDPTGEPKRLQTLLLDLQELLRLQGVTVDHQEVLVLWLNRAVHQHRTERLAVKLLEQMPKLFSIQDIIHRYIDLIGDVRPEEFGIRPLYCQTRYLAQFLLDHFDDDEIADLIEVKKFSHDRGRFEPYLEQVIQHQLGEVIRAKRVQVLRDLLLSKKPPTIPKTIESFDGLQGESFVQEVSLMFTHAGYRVTDITSEGQGADAILEKLGERIVLRSVALNFEEQVPLTVVQQTHAARAFYEGDRAWIVTNRTFHPAAMSLAGRVGIQLFDREQMACLIKQFYHIDTDYVSMLYGSQMDEDVSFTKQETKEWNLAQEH